MALPTSSPHPADRAPLAARAEKARQEMVDRLEGDGMLTGPLLREAALHVRREVLLPHAYVRTSGPGIEPIEWRLLDGSRPEDQAEWLDLLQRDGEPLEALGRGPVTGGHMTSMSTYLALTVEALQRLRPTPRGRYLDLGPGPGVSLALAAAITGPGCATGVEQDGRMAAFAQRNLDRLGLGATVVQGDALDGHAAAAPYDLIHSGIGVPRVPRAWVKQLTPDGRLLTTLATRPAGGGRPKTACGGAHRGTGPATVRRCPLPGAGASGLPPNRCAGPPYPPGLSPATGPGRPRPGPRQGRPAPGGCPAAVGAGG